MSPDCETSARLRQLLLTSRVWSELLYKPELQIYNESLDQGPLSSTFESICDPENLIESQLDAEAVNKDSDDNKISVDLRCQAFDSILPDLLLIKSIEYLRNLTIDFSMTSACSNIYYHVLVENIQYSLSSLLLNLEFKYPFVFSYYGRHLLRLNYRNLTLNMAMLAPPLIENSSKLSQIVEIALAKLENAIVTEFNTLNVMKECDLSAHRTKMCREYINKLVKDDARRSIKSKAYSVTFISRTDLA